MFKKIKKIAFILFISTNLFALTEGKEYEVLKKPIANSDNSITEIWSYQCSHCYKHQIAKTVQELANISNDVKINMMMVKTWGKFGKEMANLLAYAQYQDEKNNIKLYDENSLYHNISKIYFVDVFKNKQTWDNNADNFYKSGLKLLGISKRQLNKFIESPEGQYLLQSTDIADIIADKTGTPSFIVNGKYLIKLENLQSMQDLINVAKELINK
ncbi:hypothetical protein [Campylobacter sp. MG1]|uniref:hypothetical protein n=1 Tax=Campylobacter sp. MG1 TaxID=2976332 RepID=UPI00226D2BF7|nr:hypothetical protein [Campylobacter sp. MG1]